MAGIAAILKQLRSFMATQRTEGHTDARLLEQFVSQRDELAFAALLERHGPMVLSVCRRILHDEHRAEDAFQATFLVLCRKANAIRKQTSIASWLHGVAVRLALKAKADAVRAARPDLRNPSDKTGDIQTEANWHEAQQVLDDELQRLPENYRLPLVLCYLEGLTRDEAAARLGWTANQLRGRLERGRDRLRARLIRRGVTLAVAGSTSLLADTILAATVPPLLAVATVRAAAQLATGSTLAACGVSLTVVSMTEGGLKMLAAKKMVTVVAITLATALIGLGAGLVTQRSEPAQARQADDPPVLAAAQEPAKKAEPNAARVDRDGEPLPDGVIARLGTTRFRHTQFVRGLAYTPDGRYVVSACSDNAAHLWDAETGKEIRRFQGEAKPGATILNVAVTSDGKSLIGMQNAGLMHVWDIATGQERFKLKGGNGFALALSPDGKTVAKGLSGEDNRKQIALWDIETGQLIRTVGAADRIVGGLAFSRDGKLLASGETFVSGGADTAASVRLWDPADGRMIRELTGHTGWVTAVAFSPAENLMASTSHDRTIRLWNHDGKLVRVINVPEDPPIRDDSLAGGPGGRKGISLGGVLCVTFSPDGKWIASGGHDGCVRLWDASTGNALHTMPGHGREVMSVVFSRDGKILASGSYDQTIRLWDPVTGKDHQPRTGHPGPVQAIAISPDGTLAATACWYRAIHVWSLASGEPIHELRGHTENIFSVAFSPDGKHLASGSADQTIRIWDLATGREVRQLLGHHGASYVAFTSVDNMLLSGGSYDGIRFWDWAHGKQIRQINLKGVSQMSISRDGRVVGSTRDKAALWDVATGKELRALPSRCHLAIAPDGRTFVTQENDGLIHQGNTATGERLLAFPGPKYAGSWSGPTVLVLSPDSRLLAMRQGKGVEFWEMATGKRRQRLADHPGGVVSFVFTPDGQRMLTGGPDTTVLIWDLTRRLENRSARLSLADLESLWRDLGGDNAECADRAICTLVASADQSVPFLSKHICPVVAPDPKRLSALITDLNSDNFAIRDKALKELQSLRELANPALKEGRAEAPSLETHRRIDDLLVKQCTPLAAGELLQTLRAVEVLERIANGDARQILQNLTTGPAHARVTQEANGALQRMKQVSAAIAGP